MTNIIIDNKSYELDPEQNLLQAALSVGLDLPYFCWHPALGSVGSCRQCAVQQFADDSDKLGRTVMACMTPITPNARFGIAHPTALAFRKQVIEWLMINHPHDCPVCDEGGECHLQDMTLMTGHNTRQYRFLKRTFVNQNLGPFINHEMNRCITCYRCVRFYKDVAGGDDLHAFKSSNRVYFGRHESGTLNSEFSGNLAEVCPTGVFTDKVFHHHYTRKWDLATAPSICQLCSLGCNISPGERYGQVRRIQNRYHPDINSYFICDRGRFGHEYVNSPERINLVNNSDSFLDAKKILKPATKVIGIGSARASLEANWLLQKIVGAENFYDGLPNQQSLLQAQMINLMSKRSINLSSLKNIEEADTIVIIGEDILQSAPMMGLSVRKALINHKKNRSHADLKIPYYNDTAIRDYARDISLPIFSANIMASGLDDLACANLALHTADLVSLLKNLRELMSGQVLDPQTKHISWLMATQTALLAAKNPVIISGASLGEQALISLVFDLVNLIGDHAKLSMVFNEANSVGLGLLKPNNLSKLNNKPIDVAIVLENDLHWRLGEPAFADFVIRVKKLLVIDSLASNTTKKASVLLPCASFAESTGTIVNQEGRMQRFFSVFNNTNTAPSSWRVLSSCLDDDSSYNFHNIDDINAAMALDLNWPTDIFASLFSADFKVAGQAIARMSSEFSGRTAINADVSMHEAKPKADPDSPLVYSMEGARRRIPLPLISSSWEPQWNSVQASFKYKATPSSGVLLFMKNKAHEPQKIYEQTKAKVYHLPEIYVIPRYQIFGSEERARFSQALASRIGPVLAYLSAVDAANLNLNSGTKISLVSFAKSYDFFVQIEKSLAPGLLALPFGLVDASLFYEPAVIKELL